MTKAPTVPDHIWQIILQIPLLNSGIDAEQRFAVGPAELKRR